MRLVEPHSNNISVQVITIPQATLTEHVLRGTPREAKFTLTVLMKEFAAFKGDLPAIIEPSVVEKRQLHNMEVYKQEH